MPEPLARPGPVRLPYRLADFGARGFRLDRPEVRELLEGHARAFLLGFNLALSHPRRVHDALATVPAHRRGFAYEGAGMLAGFLDTATGGRAGALRRLLSGPGDRYVHLVHVGYGWPPAPVRTRLPAPLPATPLLRWLALDGAGFADVFFSGRAAALRNALALPEGARRSARTAGAGRALWFVQAAHVTGLRGEVAAAHPDLRPDLWAGIGLAATYAGGVDHDGLVALADAAGPAAADLRQGVMFGAAARARAGDVPEHTSLAAQVLLGAGAETARSWTDTAAADLLTRTDAEAYGLWRSRLRDRAIAMAGR